MLSRIRNGLDRAVLFARTIHTSKSLKFVSPLGLTQFIRAARRTGLGPHVAISFHAVTQPDREALVEYAGDTVRRFTWRQLDEEINRIAHALVARGVAAGSRVALMLPNGAEFLLAQQALARLGAIAVQIGYRLKPAEISYILGNSQPIATIVHAEQLTAMRTARKLASQQAASDNPPVIATLPEIASQTRLSGGLAFAKQAASDNPPVIATLPEIASQIRLSGGLSFAKQADVLVVGDAATLEPDETLWTSALTTAADPSLPPLSRGADGGGAIVYTSGTTGKPKGASRSWKSTGLESVADMVVQVGMNAHDRHLVVCPLYHSAAPAFIAIMLGLGASIVLMNHFDPEGALSIIERERVTCSLMVPTMLVRMCNLPEPVRRRYKTDSLRWILSGAAPLSTEAARRFMAEFGPILWNFYGATETGLVTMAGPADHLSHPGTIGRGLRGNVIRLIDDKGDDAPAGEVGELFVANSTLISGYHNDAAATDAAQRAGYFSVGDLATRDADGFYYLASRKHDMVISGGVNIYPREIEDYLETHPAILEAAVIGVPDPEWGESLRAFIVLRSGYNVTTPEVIEFVARGSLTTSDRGPLRSSPNFRATRRGRS